LLTHYRVEKDSRQATLLEYIVQDGNRVSFQHDVRTKTLLLAPGIHRHPCHSAKFSLSRPFALGRKQPSVTGSYWPKADIHDDPLQSENSRKHSSNVTIVATFAKIK
jgi:hypothetical protein